MTQTHAVLDMEPLGIRVEVRRTAEETNGELFEMDVIGRPRAFFAQRHIHPHQTERLEMIAGGDEGGRWPDAITSSTRASRSRSPAGTPHTQVPVGDGPGQVRIQVRPAGQSQAFLEHLSQLCRDRKVTRSGFPRPRAAAGLILDYADAGHAATPPLSVQRAIARVLLALGGSARPYEFVDEWDVAARPEAVFAAIADARTYPQWWKPVYIDVEADGPPRVGGVSTQHFKSRLPYHLHTRSVTTAVDAPALDHGRRRRRPPRARHLDADPDGSRHARALRLARVRRPQAAADAHADSPPGPAGESQLGDRAREGGTGAVRTVVGQPGPEL